MLRCAFLTIAAILLASSPGQAVDRKPETDAAFNRDVQLSEQRMQNDLQSGPFLWVDELPPQQREAVSARLKRGEVATQRLETLERGASIPVPGGLIHHWVGVVFIPGANLTQTLALLQGYDEHSRIYAPRVLRSKLIQHNGDDFKVFLRLRETKLVTVVLDTEYDVRYVRLDSTRAYSRSYSTGWQKWKAQDSWASSKNRSGTTAVFSGDSIPTGASGSAMAACTSNWKLSRSPAASPTGLAGSFVHSSPA
jgi:hypothetical protein